MLQTIKSTAEEKFAAIQKKEKQFRTEKEKAQRERMELTAKLRALRLAKEADDMKAAKKEAAKKARDKNKKSAKSR